MVSSSVTREDVEKAVVEDIPTVEHDGTKRNLSIKTSAIGADDPFYPREGKTLRWTGVNMTLRGSKKKGDKKILNEVWGEVPKKEITAVMGPSGSGKTSLLNILSGRARSRGNLVIGADIRFDNVAVDPTKLEVRKLIAFVGQDDSLMATATVREAIRFSAKLRLPRATTDDELNTITTRMIMELGLSNCADTYVGSALIKGISGGERKRTSVGVELVVKPSLVFLDEPTSGLDSFSALQITQVLHKVANAGSSVLFTIHQPSSEIFEAFDHLILLNKGRVMYQGSVTEVPKYFGQKGNPLPPNYNPADWIMTIAQKYTEEELDTAGYFPKDQRNLGEASHASKLSKDVDALGNSFHGVHGIELTKRVSVFTQIRMLYTREFQNLGRDKASLAARFGITIFMNLLFGLIFQNVGKKDSADLNNVQAQFGAVVLTMLNVMFGTAQPAIFGIPAERPVFVREYSTDHYSVASYFLARLTVEAIITLLQVFVQSILVWNLMQFQSPFFTYTFALYVLGMASTAVAVFLGCSVTNMKSAQELLPLVFVPQMLFAGFFIPLRNLPVWLRWIQYICSLTYGIRIAMYAEFGKCAAGVGEAADNCNRVLTGLNADDPNNRWWWWLILVALFVVIRLCALIVLRKKATQFF